jgi:prophage regulatory protein
VTYFILRPRAACVRLGLGRSAFYSRIAARLLPEPVSLGGRAVGIPEHELDAVIGARIAGKSDSEIRELVRQLEAARATYGHVPIGAALSATRDAPGQRMAA